MQQKFYQKTWFKILAGLFILGIIANILNPDTENYSATTKGKTEKELPSLNMAKIKARRYVKEMMRDPDSFEEISTDAAFLKEYKKDTTQYKYIQALVAYRARNGFGGMNTGMHVVIMDAKFNPIEIFEKK